MTSLDDETRLPDDFDNRVRLFPLPELVVFPHAMQPLHIFEPRYCEMLDEALSGDRLIAMATLVGGIGSIAASDPPIASTVCIGKVVSHSEVEPNRHNLLLVGIQRAEIVAEVNAGRSFRIAEVEVHGDVYPPTGSERRGDLKRDLLAAFSSVIPPSESVQKNLHDLMAGSMGLGPITDVISYMLPFACEHKLRLLAMADVDARAAELIELLRSGAVELDWMAVEKKTISEQIEPDAESGGKKFPPDFSAN